MCGIQSFCFPSSPDFDETTFECLSVRLDFCHCRYSHGNTSQMSDRFTAQQSMSSAHKMFLVFVQLNLALSSCPVLSNPACDGDFFSPSPFFPSLLFFSHLSSFHILSVSPVLPWLSAALLFLLLLCCVHVGSDSLQKAGLQPRRLALGLQGQYEARPWWRECKYCLAYNQSSHASAN